MEQYCRVVVSAPAKLNLTLDITGVDSRGYHLMEMVMQTVDLCDLVVIGLEDMPGIHLSCAAPGVPLDEANLAHRAASLFLRRWGGVPPGLSIHLHKRIPAQAGLAGGSADAAGVLVGLNSLLGAGYTTDVLCKMGLELGADVPFSIVGGTSLAQGIGEKLTPLPPLNLGWFCIAKPAVGTSTKEAFRRYDQQAPTLGRPDTPAMLQALEERSLPQIGGLLANVLQQVNPVPEVESIQAAMLRHGALGARMTGSGSAVFGLFAERDAAEVCEKELRGVVARPVGNGAKVVYMD